MELRLNRIPVIFWLAIRDLASPVCRGQRAARLPLVRMVVPLVATSNSFAPLADDDDQPTVVPGANSASVPPASSALSEVTSVRWTEVMTALYEKRSINHTLGMDAVNTEGWMFADHHATTSARDPPAYSCNRLVGSRPEVGKPDLPTNSGPSEFFE